MQGQGSREGEGEREGARAGGGVVQEQCAAQCLAARQGPRVLRARVAGAVVERCVYVT